MKADLHMHSRYSDGSESLESLMEMAVRRGLTHVSVTDHDSTRSQLAAAEEAHRHGLGYITGIEISAKDPVSKRKVHILGYGFPLPSPRLESSVHTILKQRDSMTRRQVQILRDLGYPLSISEVEDEAGNLTVLYKQHIMAVLARKGIADGLRGDFYQKTFKNGGPCDLEITYIDATLAIQAIREAGGFPVLAHPGQGEVQDLLPFLKLSGLAGVELEHPDNPPGLKAELREWATQLKIILTGGSDYHGFYGNEPEVGSFLAPDVDLLTEWAFCTMGKLRDLVKCSCNNNHLLTLSHR